MKPQSMDQDLGKLLKAARLKNYITQRKVAEFLNVSLRTVAAWEAGTRRPTPLHLERLMPYLHMPLMEILSVRRLAIRLPVRRVMKPMPFLLEAKFQ